MYKLERRRMVLLALGLSEKGPTGKNRHVKAGKPIKHLGRALEVLIVGN